MWYKMQNAHASIDCFSYWSDLKETHMSNCDFSSFVFFVQKYQIRPQQLIFGF